MLKRLIKTQQSFQQGGFIPTEGIYHLHAGETVIPASQQGLETNLVVNITTEDGEVTSQQTNQEIRTTT